MDFLCLEFVNSSWYITHKLFVDPLQDKSWRIRLTEKWGKTTLAEPTEIELKELLQMRNMLAKLFQKILDGSQLSKGDIAIMNNYMGNMLYHKQLLDGEASYELAEVPQAQNWHWFISEIAASFSKLYTSEAIARLKACQNPECRWLFIDDSKSGARKWCDDTCATLMKVRRFRQKQKKEGS